jgi:mannose-6-phosphate isomerase
MNMLDKPLRFEPYLRPMVWGGRRLATVLGKKLEGDGLYGESWEVSDHASHLSRVTTGPWAGMTLHGLMRDQRQALLGAAAAEYDTFPWLIKFLDACDWLSVQVHPNEKDVRRLLPGEGSKTEAWFILDAQVGSRIYAGLNHGVDEKQIRNALANGTITSCLHSFAPRAGQFVFLPAGTVHAIGGGVLFAEVQQTSDATFRLYDWDRRDAQGKSRPLHIEQSLACINWNQGPVQPVTVHGFDQEGASINQDLVKCRYFHLRYVRSQDSFALAGAGQLQAFMVLDGHGRWTVSNSEEVLAVGDTWVVPAAAQPVRCLPQPRLGMLISTLEG